MSGNSKASSPVPLAAYQKGILAVALITSFIIPFMGSALNLSVTDMGTEFHAGVTTITWVINAFTLTTAVLAVPFGHLADTTGHQRILIAGVGLFALCCVAAAVSSSILLLIIVRVLQGLAAAMISGTNIPLLTGAFPPSHRGKVLGLSVTATYVGLSLGPVLGGIINAALGWRAIFCLTFFVCATSFFLARRFTQEDRRPSPPVSDRLGNVLYMLMIAALMLGLSEWSGKGWAKALVIISIPLFFWFVRHELKTTAPVVQVSLFQHDFGYSLSNLAALLNYGSTFAVGYTMSLYLQNVHGMSSSTAGLVLCSQPIMMAILSPMAGRLSDRIPPYKLASLGMLITSCGLFFLSRIHASLPLWHIVLPLLVIGIGFGLFSSPNMNAVLSCVDKRHYGEANSILSTMRTLGQSSSMVMVLFILGSTLGNIVVTQASPEVLTGAIRTTLLASGFICLVGTGISLVRGRPYRKNIVV